MASLICGNFLNFQSVRRFSQVRTGRTLPQKLLDRSKGQHILKNDKLLQRIVNSVDIHESDVVLEVGCGSGNLTLRILEQCAKLYAVDVDARMVNILHKRVHKYYNEFSPRLHCMIGDALKMRIPSDIDYILSNAPFQISSELIFKLLASNYFKAAILLFQEEFIQKLVSKTNSKQYSRLSVNAQMHCKIERLFDIERHHFQPPPNVDCGVVKLVPYNTDNNPWMKDIQHKYSFVPLLLDTHGKYTNAEEMDQELLKRKLFEYEQWNEFLKICFSQKNKKLPSVFNIALQKTKTRIRYAGNTLNYGENAATVIKDVFDKLNMSSHRANGTCIADFLRLYDELRSQNIKFHS